ncbi:MAG: GspH/FimT family pseudopilin [Gemmatimonadota bacterium]
MQHNPDRTRARSAGFSAIELLTVLVLVGVLTSLAAPAMGAYVDASRTRRAVDHFVADIAFARLLAVNEGRRIAVDIGADATYTVERLSTDGTWSTLRTVRLRDEYVGVSVVSGNARFEFSSRGLMTNETTDSTIEITRNDASAVAFVSPAGRVYREY